MHRTPNFPHRSAGFSLVEIMIVIVLIGGILALVTNRVMNSQSQANVRLAGVQLTTLAGKIDQFRADTGKLPESLQQMVTSPGLPGWLGPYAKTTELKDPWNNPYAYKTPGEDKPFDLVSYGKDGKPGGTSVDADIVFE